MNLRIGSFCSGYGGLDMAVQQVLGGELAWAADPDPGASAVLAHHWPHVPNLGDITATDFAQVEPVDIVCAGFPCQDISYAGRGEGIQEGNRSGLWHTIADALGVLRPRVVVLENVAAIVVRRPGLDVVLADLAALGFDAEWTGLRASDVGAPHRRERWFLVARHPDRVAGPPRGALNRRPGTLAEPGPFERVVRPDRLPAADTDRNALRQQPVPECRSGGAAIAGLAGVKRGAYGPAIRQWERVLGRPGPHPTERAPKGGQRLSPIFVEWLMGLPTGHVTAVPGLTRNQQLRLLGNGVVPQQGAAALSLLFDAMRKEVAA